MPTLARWHSTWTGLGVAPPADGVHAALIARYGEPHRRYHTVPASRGVLRAARRGAHAGRARPEIELALWFHDAVYDTHRSDSEAQSAALARAKASAPDCRLPSWRHRRVDSGDTA